jgi:hypothetical protein
MKAITNQPTKKPTNAIHRMVPFFKIYNFSVDQKSQTLVVFEGLITLFIKPRDWAIFSKC